MAFSLLLIIPLEEQYLWEGGIRPCHLFYSHDNRIVIPSVFVSSTVRDLQHMRDAIRDTISDLAYNPVLSEFGDIGYLPQHSAPDSCYIAARDCQLAVLIIGKRYGELSSNGNSITHQEFKTLRDNSIPIITLIDKEVWTFKRVYDANKVNTSTCADYPGMDRPEKSFALIGEVLDSPVNNGLIEFEHVADARENVKKQLAHIFGN
jgi:hypothetical protein